jgi:16S rRNA processing protein RimM
MNKDQCFELGYIERAHGYNGAVLAKFDVDQPSKYGKIDAVLIEIGRQLVPFVVVSITDTQKGRFILHLDGVVSEEKANSLKGSTLFLPEVLLPRLKKDQYYFHELIGCKVVDEREGELGLISEIIDMPHQVLASMDWNETSVLIPLHGDIVKTLNRSDKLVHTCLPEGLLDVYLKPMDNQEEYAN